ncbi:MAG: tetratricopeptide repeat protein, partial [Planctomycetes bacterium]|nr:tetratricopeptide repeat protein [Planctomycetota bacterium]
MTSSANAASTPALSPWFRSAPFDLLLILGVPFFTWPLVMAGQRAFGHELLGKLILLTATGHYFATFVRTYGDLELFARFKVRFVLTPVLLLVTCTLLFAAGREGALLLVTAGWAFWHWLAQAFGFARIYDIKVGSFRPLTAFLDKALVVTGFFGAITLNPGSIALFGKLFLDAGMPLPNAGQFAMLQTVVVAAMALVGLCYLVNLGWTIARGLPWSWQKQFMHATTIGYYWFAYAWLGNVLVAYVLYELFHDIQYYAITWLTCRQRVRRPGVASWLARMFRPSRVASVTFVVLMCAFGAVDIYGRNELFTAGVGHQTWLGVILTAALLHYYYDGFIWKARESSLGADLGVRGGLRAAVVPGLRHASLWACFFVPIVMLLAFGREGVGPTQRLRALVAIAPADFVSQADLGFALAGEGDLPAALEHYRAAIEANPDYVVARLNYGAALDLQGDLAAAAVQYQAALDRPDFKGTHRQAHVYLGVVQLLRGERQLAEANFQTGMKLGGENPVGRMLAMAAAMPAAAVDRRLAYYEALLALAPGVAEARRPLAQLLLARARFGEAAAHLQILLRANPNSVPDLV